MKFQAGRIVKFGLTVLVVYAVLGAGSYWTGRYFVFEVYTKEGVLTDLWRFGQWFILGAACMGIGYGSNESKDYWKVIENCVAYGISMIGVWFLWEGPRQFKALEHGSTLDIPVLTLPLLFGFLLAVSYVLASRVSEVALKAFQKLRKLE